MANNDNLTKARKNKNDEFYTQYEDIDKELQHYTEHFKDKVVYCNCDNPYYSNFFKWFVLNFNRIKLKKLICSCYYDLAEEQPNLFSLFDNEPKPERNYKKYPYKIEVTSVKPLKLDEYSYADYIDNIDLLLSLCNSSPVRLNGNGDFRSDECIELLKQSDIVVTNPPFSLFREYVITLREHNKDFIIIGPNNAIAYKDIFPLIKNNELWLGYGFKAGNAYFSVPNGTDTSQYTKDVYNEVTNTVKFRNCNWFTNIDHSNRHKNLILYKRYSSEEYPTYDNYDAIEVSKVQDIPCDYEGVMGVPITFLDKYNPEQFEIIKFRKGNDDKDLSINGICPYFRILIKRKQ